MSAPEGNTFAQKDDKPRDDQLVIRLNKDDKQMWKAAAGTDPDRSRNDIILSVMNPYFEAMLKKSGGAK